MGDGRRALKFTVASVLCLLLTLSACGPRPESSSEPLPLSESTDSDGDGVPDHVELAVGTDPHHQDSDGDGLSDHYELVIKPRIGASTQSSSDGAGRSFLTAAAYASAQSTSASVDWNAIKNAPYDSTGNGIPDAADGWTHNLTYTLEKDIAGQVHSAIKDSNKWWSGDGTIPTASQYNQAFLGLLVDEENTPAPLVDGAQPVVPDLADGFTEQQALTAWSQVTWEAKLWTGFLDDDGDGLPNAWEAYGYTVKYDKKTAHRYLEPWGIEVTGRAQYRRSATGNGPFDDLLPQPTLENKRPSIIGASATPIDKPDYTKQYFKTSAVRVLSDGDPDTDYDEAFGKEGTQGSRPPYTSPVVGAFPEFNIEVTQVTISAKETITDTNGKTIQEMGPSQAQDIAKHLPGFLRAPIDKVSGALSANSPSVSVPTDDGQGDGEDEAGPAGESKMSSFLSKAPTVIGQVSALFAPQPTGNTVQLSRATCVNTADAARGAFALKVTNSGGAKAMKVAPAFSLFLGDKPVGGLVTVDATLDFPTETSRTVNASVGSLTLDEYKAFQSGAAFTIVPAMTGGQVESVTYDSKTHKEVVVEQGSWDVFQNNTKQLNGTIVIDGGKGFFAKYAVQGQRLNDGPEVTVSDALRWSVGYYPSGMARGYRVPAFDGSNTSMPVVDWKDWIFVFYRSGTTADPGGPDYVDADFVGHASPLTMAFKPGSIVYVIHKDRFNTTPSIAYATMGLVSADKVNSRIVAVGLTNAEECPAGTEVYFVPDTKTDQSTWFDAKHRLTDNEDRTYSLSLDSYSYTGREAVVARVNGMGSDGKPVALISKSFPVSVYDRTDIFNTVLMATDGYVIKAGTAKRPTGTVALSSVGSDTTVDKGGSISTAANARGVVVQTHRGPRDSQDRNMFYRVGILNFKTGAISWGESHQYDTGTSPRVAVMDNGTVVEVHRAESDTTLWCNVGTVDATGKTISWGGAKKYDSGTEPSVAVAEDGTVVEVHRAQSNSTVYYHVGTVNSRTKTVSWASSNGTKYDTGSWPAVTILPDGTLVETHKAPDDTGLWYHVGVLNKSTRVVAWGDSHKYDTAMSQADDGGSIALASTADGVVLEAHMGSSKGDIWYSLGTLHTGTKTVDWTSSTRFSSLAPSEPGIAFSRVPTR